MEVKHISLPYIYPLCPLNFNHARMFVIADVYARYYKNKFSNSLIIFPMASHFSGNTAQKTSELLKEYFFGEKNEINIQVFNLHRSFYGTPLNCVKEFTDSNYLMKYYHNEIIWELKNLSVSCDYKHAYTTQTFSFSAFVKSMIKKYKEMGLLTINKNGDIAVNYDNENWKIGTLKLINNTKILQENQKKSILSVFDNLSSDWEMLRNNGFGVDFNNDGMIVDPMFDSELLMIYDLFIFWKNKYNINVKDIDSFFDILFSALKDNTIREQNLSSDEEKLMHLILDSLPCDIFFAEDHLKNWICKKFFAEEKFLFPKFYTKEYRILGIGLLNNKRMSASRGYTILPRNLIREFGGSISRLILLLNGGNISKQYNYDYKSPEIAKKMIEKFINYWFFLNSDYEGGETTVSLGDLSLSIDSMIKEGHIQKAIIELLVNIPKRYKRPNKAGRKTLIELYSTYISMFLPGLSLC